MQSFVIDILKIVPTDIVCDMMNAPGSRIACHTTSCPAFQQIRLVLSGIVLILIHLIEPGVASSDEYRLLQDLFERREGGYNPRIRPVENISDVIETGFEMALIQLINLDEKNQIMKTNVWLRLHWCDYQLTWNTKEYGGIDVIRIQPDRVWKPDIVLYNNADGKFEVSFKANVLIFHNGFVMWIPCTIYKSSCNIDVTYFPFDEQTCIMSFASWTYFSNEVKLNWYLPADPWDRLYNMIDLSDYEKSGTWDLVDIPGEIFEKDDRTYITYKLKLRRKTLFYTVNLILPCLLISILSTVVFSLPVDSGEKTTMAVSILLALVVFLQVLVTNLLPPSSTSFPLFAKYLLFAVILDVCTVVNTIFVLNWHFKTPRTHRMSRIIRLLFFGFLPKILLMKRPDADQPAGEFITLSRCSSTPMTTPETSRRLAIKPDEFDMSDMHSTTCPLRQRKPGSRGDSIRIEPEMNKAVEAVRFISAHLKNEDDYDEVIDDWRYVAQVIDRLLFYIYIVVTVVTTMSILINAPHLFESFEQEAIKKHWKDIHANMTVETGGYMYCCEYDGEKRCL